MNKISLNNLFRLLTSCIVVSILTIISLSLFSFTVNKLNVDFLKELGIDKPGADKKITESILGGYLNEYGVKNARNIATGNRAAVVKALLDYTKQYVSGTVFKNDYVALKESNRPKENKVKTPEEMRKEEIEAARKAVADAENLIKKGDATTKPIFENVLAENKKQLREVEDPNNKRMAAYKKNYPELAMTMRESYEVELKKWETQYPANHLLFVKQRLQQFLVQTNDIDFTAELALKGSKKIFVNPTYEGKSKSWKMAFRAGKEVVVPASVFVTQWIAEIK
jgi:nitrogen fixation protein FixH